MATLTFDQTGGFEAWAQELVKHISDESDEQSFGAVVKKWSEYCETASQEKIFTGPAAEINFNKFKEVNDAFQKFFNELAGETKRVTEEVQKTMNEMESTVAIGGGVDIGQLAIEAPTISPVPDFTPSQEIIDYDTDALRTLSDNIGKLNDDLESTKTFIENHLDKLNSGQQIWDGNFAMSYANAIKETLANNIPKIEDDVTGVSDYINNNIAQVAEDVDNKTVTSA